jgi:hypothetical protein
MRRIKFAPKKGAYPSVDHNKNAIRTMPSTKLSRWQWKKSRTQKKAKVMTFSNMMTMVEEWSV